ncbi:MAG: hypothetical protein EAZ16_04510 [Sphingobacteriales bacterium]|nr:MAG: hypothetical protein EAZ16_04510 [Sphingobacteriales bacterium]
MEYNKIIAVTGLPGLYELLSSKSDGAIVKSLDDSSTRFVASRVHNFSHLETIEIFTVRDNVNLVDIFNAMEKNSATLPDEKDAKAIKAYFEKVYPDMDFERVYNSDMKKMVKWYVVLKANNVEIKLTEYEAETIEEPAAEPAIEATKPAPKAKAAKKKEEVTDAAAEEAPKKKTTRAKKEETATEEETPKKKAPAKKK